MNQIVNWKKGCIFSLIFLQSFYVFSQKKHNKVNKLPLLEQFEYTYKNSYTYKKSGTYQVYKVIHKDLFFKLKKNVIDTVKSLKYQLKSDRKTIINQKLMIEKANLSLKETKRKIEGLTREKERISFLGIPLKKGVYNTVLFLIIAVLSLLLGFFIFKFKNSNQITKKTKKDLEELNTEFENHRTKALEREQKVRRELQDFINKNKQN